MIADFFEREEVKPYVKIASISIRRTEFLTRATPKAGASAVCVGDLSINGADNGIAPTSLCR